jgi:hypothetical protein
MKHLDENEIAAYIEAIIAEKTDELPVNILDHVEECLECKKAIVDTVEISTE